MSTDDPAPLKTTGSNPIGAPPAKSLPAAAQRALAEAAARRAARAAAEINAPTEVRGRGGLDPARYGDWEIKGIAADF